MEMLHQTIRDLFEKKNLKTFFKGGLTFEDENPNKTNKVSMYIGQAEVIPTSCSKIENMEVEFRIYCADHETLYEGITLWERVFDFARLKYPDVNPSTNEPCWTSLAFMPVKKVTSTSQHDHIAILTYQHIRSIARWA